MVFRIKLADRIISIDAFSKYSRSYCQEYLVNNKTATADISINVTSEDSKQRDGELLAIYRKIAMQLINYDTLLIHGSAISVDGRAYLFIAPSGTGKSTHTRLWREHFGHRALMVNDDKPLIKIEDDVVYACGTPWSGKHRLDNNVMVPLAGICFLARADKNLIEKLRAEDAYEYLLRQTFRPEEDDLSIKTFDLLDKLLSIVPFYKMKVNNFADDAVSTSYEAMVPGGDSIRIWDYVNSGNTLLKTVVGISMEPLLHARTSIVKIEKPKSDLNVNDVVLFMRPNGDYVLHRIVKVRESDYLICGDNQIWYEIVPKDMIVGIMIEYSPDGAEFYSIESPEYLSYVKKHCNFYWLKYYVNWIKSFPGRVIRKIRKIVGA